MLPNRLRRPRRTSISRRAASEASCGGLLCRAQTPVRAEQFSSMEHDAFRVPYLSDKAPEDEFHGQAVKTVA